MICSWALRSAATPFAFHRTPNHLALPFLRSQVCPTRPRALALVQRYHRVRLVFARNNTMTKTAGHCFCGAVTFAYSGPQTWACYFHCTDCRRNCAGPVVAFLGTPLDGFDWTGQTPKQYYSSKGVTRHFCDTCGTPMAFQADHYTGEIHLYAATLTNPTEFKLNSHDFT